MRLRHVLALALVTCASLVVAPGPAHAADLADLADIPAPVVTWPDQSAIGGDNPPYVLQVSDTDPAAEGTVLLAVFRGDARQVNRSGDTTLAFDADGTGTIVIERCTPDWRTCASTGAVSPEVTVRGPIYVSTRVRALTAGGDQRSIPVDVDASRDGSYLMDWWVEEAPSAGATDVPVTIDGTTTLDFEVADLPDGKYHLRVRLREEVPGFGVVSGTAPHAGFRVLNTAPVAKRIKLSDDELYPERDGYKDSLTIWARTEGQIGYEIVDSHGQVVFRSVQTDTYLGDDWRGLDDDREPVAPGRYRIRVTTSDYLGNSATVDVGSVRVRPGRVHWKTYEHTVSARSSMVDHQTGACSRLAGPVRGWSGSIGLYSNATCSRSRQAGTVVTVHQLRIPDAVHYREMRLHLYGGAATTAPRSLLGVNIYTPGQGWSTSATTAEPKVAQRSVRSCARELCVDSAHRVTWAVFTAAGAQYDVRSFTLTMRYQVVG